MVEVIYKRAETSNELQQILELQQRNIKAVLTDNTIKTEGYVTVEHSFEILKRMNDACPHIIATVNENVVGYALCMLNAFRHDVPILEPMFAYIDKIMVFRGLINLKYLIMGQICIDSAYRRKGIFRGLYHHFKTELKADFDAVITEVNAKNIRSFEAHKSIGFQTLDTHVEHEDVWKLIIWRWN